jgi:acyl-CoA thioester hydrolase
MLTGKLESMGLLRFIVNKESLERVSSHQTRFRVRYAETDQMGVVYYANYLVWMEIGRGELVRALGFQYKDLEENEGLYLSVVEANCRYVYPARYDQEIAVETSILNAASRMVEFGYRIGSVEPERLLAEGFTRHIWLNREWKPTSLPKRYRAALGGV